MRYLPLFLLLIAVGACTPSAPEAVPEASAALTPATWTLADRPLPATVAAAANGDAVAAFAREGHVYVQRVRADGQAESAVVVNPDSENVAVHAQAPAQVALLPDGSVLVAWVKQTPVPGRRFPASEIRVARSSDGGRTFTPPVTASDGADIVTGRHFHDLTVATDGTVYLSWLDGRARDGVRQKEATPVVAVSHGSHAGHVRRVHGGPGTEIRVTRSDDGGQTFGPSVVVAAGTCECCRTALAVAPDGALFVAWRHQFTPDVRDVAVARSADGGQTFSAPVRLPAPPWHVEGCPHTGPALAIAADGAVHALWFTGADEAPGTYYATSTDGGQTFTSARIAAGNRIAQARLRADGGGVLALWEGGEGLHLGHLGTDALPADTLAGHGPDLARTGTTAWFIRQTDTQTLLERRAL